MPISTLDYPLLTTFFEAEIVGRKYSFLTNKWEADEAVDRQHWGKFSSCEKFADKLTDKGFRYDCAREDNIYMRWKEHFLVPDHKVRSIAGASFAGFYYICYQRSTDTIEGFYYHKKSDW
ncbi:hypothetical protein SARC_00537 [Sphaeroforma arctica JP610]|uniref:Uncharacterized protein n=1 Tax=Sphaeroforma arctica JP610 TaxID=667725 RepID=A0A0L0GE95_9EUKA|nr:hypothetical protein SARC_00537 [Sphaeroforma arctica JP610]KNC87347.1 hypothetical protein SARC_00537 [Sphaeroforma arctica JP610]|eukprot:XP_014161249.1 hypothetical protein SARC_00537 [Sphaeroforma arctica JP610]